MKRTILFLFAVCLGLFSLTVEGQRRKRPPISAPKPAPEKPNTEAAKPAAESAYNGSWSGKTAQQKDISFEVDNGQITNLSARGLFQGGGCSSESKSSTKPNQTIIGNKFSITAPSGPGGMSMQITGKFVSPTKACGVASMTLHPIPGPPPGVPGYVPSCGGSIEAVWVATLAGTDRWEPDPNCPQPSEYTGSGSQSGNIPRVMRANPYGYFISDVVLGDPAGTMRLGQPLKGRIRIQRGAMAPSDRILVQLIWLSSSIETGIGQVSLSNPITLPAPDHEAEVMFQVAGLPKDKLTASIDNFVNITKKPRPTISELEVAVQLVQQREWYEFRPLGNKVTAIVKIVE